MCYRRACIGAASSDAGVSMHLKRKSGTIGEVEGKVEEEEKKRARGRLNVAIAAS